jgi:hypothetical protein
LLGPGVIQVTKVKPTRLAIRALSTLRIR